jgi:hypothetical protein
MLPEKQNELSLFAVYLGGRMPGCNIELHDVVFVVAHTIENAYPTLAKKWFGDRKSLHIDSYITLKCVDGYEIKLYKDIPPKNDNKLFLVNYGGYHSNQFGEAHEISFYVGAHKKEVREKAMRHLGVNFIQRHVDDNRVVTDKKNKTTGYVIDDIFDVAEVDGYYISLEPTDTNESLQISSGYVMITE